MTITPDQLKTLLDTAISAAKTAADEFYTTKMNRRDQFPCGFAWVSIYGIRKGSKLDRVLTGYGITKSSYEKAHVFWNPSDMPLQNVDVKSVGARAAADVLRQAGLTAYASERLD